MTKSGSGPTSKRCWVPQGTGSEGGGSGAEALEELKLNPFDVIVLDIRMPGMDGLTTLGEIKKINPRWR